MNKHRWGLSVDIEGFSKQYEYSEELQTKAILALRELMRAIINIGINVYPGKNEDNYSERLFAHQFGDGFVIISNFYERNSERCIAIAISLMRHMLMKGYTLKAAISTGDMADINGCYPDEISKSENNRFYLDQGLMTTIPVMGTALTLSHSLLNYKSGNVLILNSNRFEATPNINLTKDSKGICIIDWISSNLPLSKTISSMAYLEYGNKNKLMQQFEKYIKNEPIPPNSWVTSTRSSWQN